MGVARFYLAMAESQQEFKTGCVVRGIVLPGAPTPHVLERLGTMALFDRPVLVEQEEEEVV